MSVETTVGMIIAIVFLYFFLGFITYAVFHQFVVMTPYPSDKEKARSILAAVFWPIYVVGLFLYGIYWLFSRAFGKDRDGTQ